MVDGAPSGAGPRSPESDDAPLNESAASARHNRRRNLENQLRQTRATIEARQEAINKRSGRNLLGAIFFGVILGAILIVSLIFIKEIYMLLAAAIIMFGCLELGTAMRVSGLRVPRIPVAIMAVAVVPLAFYFGTEGLWLGVIACVIVTTLWRVIESLFRKPRVAGHQLVRDVGAGMLIHLYVTLLGGLSVVLTGQPGGQFWTLSFIAIVISVDTGAYVTGLNFGKHPMAPKISPSKTWEGLAGAALAAIIVGVLLSTLLLGEPIWFGVLFGACILGSATIGDLAESLIKRDLGVKDISSWLPGHGGFLDRVDSILPSAAVAYTLYYLAHLSTLAH